jgi:hypothetical protein
MRAECGQKMTEGESGERAESERERTEGVKHIGQGRRRPTLAVECMMSRSLHELRMRLALSQNTPQKYSVVTKSTWPLNRGLALHKLMSASCLVIVLCHTGLKRNTYYNILPSAQEEFPWKIELHLRCKAISSGVAPPPSKHHTFAVCADHVQAESCDHQPPRVR